MDPNISEFSYGYALTDELVNAPNAKFIGAPVFPSLYEEGQKGGGYDLKLNRPTLPLFLQFKLSSYLSRNTAREIQNGYFTEPYYRFHLRPSRFSNQHQLLLDLESSGQEIYYSAPAFHEPEELDEAYTNKTVQRRSLWIKPSEIGTLPDDKDHYVAFQLPGPRYVCSNPKRVSERSFDAIQSQIVESIRRSGKTVDNNAEWDKLAGDLVNVIEKRGDADGRLRPKKLAVTHKPLASREKVTEQRFSEAPPSEPIQRLAYTAAVYFSASLILIQEVD